MVDTYRAPRARNFVLASVALAIGLLFAGLTGRAGAATTCSATAPSITCSNTGSITINDAATDGTPRASTPEPSSIDTANVTGPVTKVTATVNGFAHGCPTDVDMLLVGPQGQDSMLMSDIGDCTHKAPGPNRADINLTFDDAAVSNVPCNVTTGPVSTINLAGGTYKPTDGPPVDQPTTCAYAESSATNDSMAVGSPVGPVGPYPSGLATFNGVNPNGTWRLYTVDQWKTDSGHIAGGWSIALTIAPPTVAAPSIVGTAQVGQTLSVNAGAVTNATNPTFQWKRCDLSGTICDVITGATGTTYTATTADLGRALVVTEAATNSGGTTSTNSAPTAAVQSPPATTTITPVTPAVVSVSGTHSTQKVLSQRGVLVSVKSDKGATLVGTGTVKVGRKTYKFKRVHSTLAPNTKSTIKLGLSSRTLKVLKTALAKGKRLQAKITLTVTSAGGKTTAHKTITLKR